MRRKIAVASYLAVCVILAVLLLTKTITTVLSGLVFAIALVLFGGLLRGFRGDEASSKPHKPGAT